VVLEYSGIAISRITEQRLVPKYDEGSSSKSNEGIADLSTFDMITHQRSRQGCMFLAAPVWMKLLQGAALSCLFLFVPTRPKNSVIAD
jgi:hypothetical protein